ncbi:hypothetical protein [Nocardia sp. CA-290969]|uniref:hypothetical protein n=1 Tax=Nocardia sp. CA-290969 TaxID=3239986 RepID=UPI003D8B4777
MSDYHDRLAEETLRLAENLREIDPAILYADLVARGRTEPERVAQMLMCALVWLDVDVTTSELVARAEAVAADRSMKAAPVGQVEVILFKDFLTDTGVLPAGSRYLATPVEGGMWELRVTDSTTVTVPEAVIRAGARKRGTLLRNRDAREEYGFARRTLGFGHHAAVAWLRSHYRVSDEQVERWLSIGRLEVAS